MYLSNLTTSPSSLLSSSFGVSLFVLDWCLGWMLSVIVVVSSRCYLL